MSISLVVAHYKENEDWLKYISTHVDSIFVYHKGDSYKYFYDKKNIINIRLLNIGRESHSYLHFIESNYIRLPEYVIFTQADPFYHCNSFEQQILDYIYVPVKPDFIAFGDYNKESSNSKTGIFVEENNTIHFIKEKYKMLLEREAPDEIIFTSGACFAVSKKQILKHPRTFYQSLLKWHEEDELAPYIMEIIWEEFFK